MRGLQANGKKTFSGNQRPPTETKAQPTNTAYSNMRRMEPPLCPPAPLKPRHYGAIEVSLLLLLLLL